MKLAFNAGEGKLRNRFNFPGQASPFKEAQLHHEVDDVSVGVLPANDYCEGKHRFWTWLEASATIEAIKIGKSCSQVKSQPAPPTSVFHNILGLYFPK
jgi:hypothetical protein